MPRFHNINGVRVQFTAQQELDKDAKEQAWRNGAYPREMAFVRKGRDRLLRATDFYALSDTVPLTEEMATYRQQLRDLPATLTTLEEAEDVHFPVKP